MHGSKLEETIEQWRRERRTRGESRAFFRDRIASLKEGIRHGSRVQHQVDEEAKGRQNIIDETVSNGVRD
jgi:hypothetical protein